MKPIIATAISIAGVLGAGSLAAAANLQVFDDGGDPAPAAAVAVREASSGSGGSADDTGAAGGASGDAVGLQTFEIADAGTMTLDATGGLHLVRLDPAPGWRAEREDDGPAGSIVVEFETDGDGDLTAVAVLGPEGIDVSVTGGDQDDDRGDDHDDDGRDDHDDDHDDDRGDDHDDDDDD